MSGRVYTFDTTYPRSDSCASQWYLSRKQREDLCKTCELFGVIVSLESVWDVQEFILDDSLQLTTFKCPKRDSRGMETVLQLGDTLQVVGYSKCSNLAFLNAVKIIVHTDPNAECKYWLQQIQRYKAENSKSKVASSWVCEERKTHNSKASAVLSFSAQVSTAAIACWKSWKKHFNQGGKVSLSTLWEVVDRENPVSMGGFYSRNRNQILQLLIHLGYLIPLQEEPETYVLLTDDILDKQVMHIFNQNITSGAVSLREVAYRLEQHFHVDEIRLERIEESILRLAYQEKVEQV
ncbi:hypothetical protein GpartN1_g2395.t1 [Galdieria partita]|uniref:Uncharacterized protein n=1 Tax=Galdieria partita TaxID=83374 RepID=A0A9C7PUD5_9RHOD|nr:hypothetical protein GpartN1_g2395.t1 [Galdieria partita]